MGNGRSFAQDLALWERNLCIVWTTCLVWMVRYVVNMNTAGFRALVPRCDRVGH